MKIMKFSLCLLVLLLATSAGAQTSEWKLSQFMANFGGYYNAWPAWVTQNSFTYGNFANAVGCGFITNSTHAPQVNGWATPSGAGGVSERDGVGCYIDFTAPAPVANQAGTFTATTFVPTTPFTSPVIAQFKVGMLVDTNDSPTKYTGTITSWAANGTSLTVSNWYKTDNTGAGTPVGTAAVVNPVTKGFGANIVHFIAPASYATASAGLEIDLKDTSSNAATNTTWNFDCFNITATNGRDCYIARGAWDYGFQSQVTGAAAQFWANPSGGATSSGFLSSQTSGNVFQSNGTMASGYLFRSPYFNVNYLGQVNVGSMTSGGTAAVYWNSSGHTNGDALITASGGTGNNDGTLAVTANAFKVNNGGVPYTLAQDAIPVIIPSSGSFGNNGALSGITALPVTYANAYLCFPVNAIASGVAAGCYYTQMSSTTAGTVCNNKLGSGSPTIPACTAFSTTGPGAYTQSTSATTMVTISLPANSLGANGALRPYFMWGFPSNTNTKTMVVQLAGNNVQAKADNTAGDVAYRSFNEIINRGVTGTQVIGGAIATIGTGTSTNTVLSVDTTSTQNITAVGTLGVATDYLIMEGFTIEVIPN